jgi:hypothetical protein
MLEIKNGDWTLVNCARRRAVATGCSKTGFFHAGEAGIPALFRDFLVGYNCGG